MTTYVLFSNLGAPNPLPPQSGVGPKGMNLPAGSQMSDLSSGGALNPTTPPVNQLFQVIVTGAGNVAGTVQRIGSNDGINWMNYGAPINVSVAASPAMAAFNDTVPFAFFSALLTSIQPASGAKAAVLMNA